MRVLLIEDDRMIGTAMQQALKDAAYAVDWVTDGQTAIHAAESESYELALLDLGLPKADGREVLRRLRTLGRRLPVIIVTARDCVDDRIDGLDLGADDYLVKPFEIRELLARMRAVLRREGSGSPPLLSNGQLSLDPATREASFLGEDDDRADLDTPGRRASDPCVRPGLKAGIKMAHSDKIATRDLTGVGTVSPREIAAGLNARGIPTARRRMARRPGSARHSSPASEPRSIRLYRKVFPDCPRTMAQSHKVHLDLGWSQIFQIYRKLKGFGIEPSFESEHVFSTSRRPAML